ncbi:hypothetical protein J5751_03170 [bacterium]|nr:hypothetical protein [bacterium]
MVLLVAELLFDVVVLSHKFELFSFQDELFSNSDFSACKELSDSIAHESVSFNC